MSDKSSKQTLSLIFIVIAVMICGLLGSFVVWRVRLAHEVNAKLQALRDAGLPMSGAELNAYYPAVPDPENAALVMTQAFALMCDYPDSRSNEVARFKIPPRGQPLTPEQKKLLTGYVELNAAALARAHEAIKLPRSRYPVDFAPGFDTLLPHNSKLKGLTLIARQKMLLAAESGNLTDTELFITDILGMAQTLDEEPVVISQMVRIAMVKIATLTMERCLNAGELSETTLTDLQIAFAACEKTNLMARALIGERATALPLFRMSWAELKRVSKASEEGNEPASGPPLPGRQPGLFRVTGFFERDLLFYLGVMETNIALAGLPPPRSLAAITTFEKVPSEAKRNYYILSGLLLPALSKAVVKEAECTACVRSAITAIAVEKFRQERGRLPESLSELSPQFLPAVPIDPFDGAPLRYHRLTKGYVIYSIGSDGHDDGGREKPTDWKSSDKTTYDITFTVER